VAFSDLDGLLAATAVRHLALLEKYRNDEVVALIRLVIVIAKPSLARNANHLATRIFDDNHMSSLAASV
jgi:hypothetical protein